jgi:hypothetical protein
MLPPAAAVAAAVAGGISLAAGLLCEGSIECIEYHTASIPASSVATTTVVLPKPRFFRGGCIGTLVVYSCSVDGTKTIG